MPNVTEEAGPPPATIRQFFLASGRPLEAPATLSDIVHAFESVGAHAFPDPSNSGTGEAAGGAPAPSTAAAPETRVVVAASGASQPSPFDMLRELLNRLEHAEA